MKMVFAICMSFIIAIVFAIMPLPHEVVWFRPAWVPLVLLYWVIAIPHRVSLGVAFLIGITLDVLQGSVFGEHALALVCIAYIAIKLHRQIRVFPMGQQVLCIMVLLALYQFLLFWIQGVVGQATNSAFFWLPPFTSMLFWPWIFSLLRDVRRRFKIY